MIRASLLLALLCASLAEAKDGDRHTIDALGVSFVLSQGLQPQGGAGPSYEFRVGPADNYRKIVIRELPGDGDLDAYATKRRAKHKKAPGIKLEETLLTVDGERAYTWVWTRVAKNSKRYTTVFKNRTTGRLVQVQLYTDLEEFPGRRTFPPAPSDGAPSKVDRAAALAFYRAIESLRISKKRR